MRQLLTLLISIWSFFVLAQPPCGTSPAAGNTCATATPICNLNGYCGNTSATYTDNSWTNGGGLFSFGNGLDNVFCGSIENNSFLSFTASSTSISFDVWVTSSTLGYGIQILIFSVDNCGTGEVTQYGPCYNPGTVQPGPVNITATGLTVGETYYIMIDGNAGDVCDYTIGANTGIATPIAVTPSSSTICSGETVDLTASGGNGTYTWDASPDLNTTTGANVTVTPPSTPGTYTYTANSNIGTSMCPNAGSTDATIIVENCGCTVTASNNGPICIGSGTTTVNLTATTLAGAAYTWSGPGGFTSNQQNPTNVSVPITAGTYDYTVTANVGGSVCQSTTTVTVSAQPDANAGADQIITCSSTSVNLNGSSTMGGTSYSWAGPGIVSGGTTLSPTVNQAGTYTLTVTNPSTGCSNTSSVNVTSSANIPDIDAGPDLVISCSSPTVQLQGNSSVPGLTISWAGPGITSGGSTLTPTVDQAGLYTVTVTNSSNGCTSTDNVTVTGNTNTPSVTTGADQILSCTSSSATITGSSATGGVTYQWTGPGITGGGTTTTATVDQAGVYTLTVTDPSNNCTNSSTVTVTNDASLPGANIAPPASINCNTSSIDLYGSSNATGVTYTWVGPGITSATNTPTVTVNQSGQYTLNVYDPGNGCSSSYSTNVIEDVTPPNITIDTPTTINCNSSTVVINANSTTSGVTYSWTGPSIVSGANSNSPTVDQSGQYTVTVSNPNNGCSATESVTISEDVAVPSVNFYADSLLACVNLNVNFYETSNQVGMTYEWDFGNGTTSTAGPAVSSNYSQPGCYTVNLTVTNPANGCSNTQNEPSYICILDEPNASFTASNTVLTSESGLVELTNTSTNATNYEWDFGDNSGTSNSVSTSHDYSDLDGVYTIQLVASNQDMCFDTARIQVRVDELLIYYVPNSFTPDGDNYNQLFQPVITSGVDIFNFSFFIYNRWGEVIWESHDPAAGWNGKYGGVDVQDGTYVWKMQFKDNKNDKSYSFHGHVNLIR